MGKPVKEKRKIHSASAFCNSFSCHLRFPECMLPMVGRRGLSAACPSLRKSVEFSVFGFILNLYWPMAEPCPLSPKLFAWLHTAKLDSFAANNLGERVRVRGMFLHAAILDSPPHPAYRPPSPPNSGEKGLVNALHQECGTNP